jgi:molybdopterin converting factor small subunit
MGCGGSGLVTLRLFGALSTAVGKRELQLPCAGATVAEALIEFVERCGEQARGFVFDRQGHRSRSLMVLLNEEPVGGAEEARLKPGDVLTLLLPLAGG